MKKRYIISFIFFLLFIIITIFMITNNTTLIDNKIYDYIIGYRNDLVDNIFKIITKLADPIPIIIVIFILLIFLNKENIYILMTTVLLTLLTNQTLKFFIKRSRPDHIRLINENSYAYPSGHAMISIAVYGFLIYLVYKKVKNKLIKIVLITVLSIIILGIGLSRIYLGVHYPSDVLAGYFITIPILVLITCLITDHYRGNINDKDNSK